MNFKTYDILSSLIPGFIILTILLNLFDVKFDNSLIVPYTAFAFLLGYIINTLSSWLEDFFFLTWGGKPSDRLLSGVDIWKVRFYHSQRVKELLTKETQNPKAKNDELFSIAMRYANGNKDSRADDFNAIYAFSRSLLTATLIGSIILFIENYFDIKFYLFLVPTLLVVWFRCKQRAYYYAREVLSFYLKIKNI